MGNSMKSSSKTHCTGVSENPVGMHSYYYFPPADLGATEIQKKLLLVSPSFGKLYCGLLAVLANPSLLFPWKVCLC